MVRMNGGLKMIFLGLLLLLAAPASAQTSHYGSIEARLPPSATAGVESFVLSGEGVRGEPGYVATAEVFGPEEKYLATCEVEWHKDTKATTCLFDDGETLKFQASDDEPAATFENLRTGERVTVRTRVAESFGESPEVSFEGDKTEEEMKREWGQELDVVGAITYEVVIFLFGSEGTHPGFGKETHLDSASS